MTQITPKSDQDSHPAQGTSSIADELKRESDRLRQLAEELKQREELQAEMQANYPLFKQVVYAMLREQFERDLPPLPDKSLEEIAKEENAQPLAALLLKLEQMKERL
jgi:N-acyl-D-aspartate/D-glutamate deacylase